MSRYPASGPVTLPTLLGDYPKTRAIREGRVNSPVVTLDVADIPTAQNGFKPLVRELAFDVAEVAIVTFLQAKAAGKPYVLLPIVINGNFHHGSLIVRADAGIDHPKDLEHRRIGMRMYSQTTPTWVRGFLENDFGVDLSTVRWVTFEDPHVREITDPPSAERADGSKKLIDMLLDGDIDAAMMGQGVPDDPRIKRLFPDPAVAAAEWREANAGAVPINHMVCVREELVAERPDAVREVFRMLVAARAAMDPAMPAAQQDLQPIGLAKLRQALERAIRYAHQQGLVDRLFTIDELFAPSTRDLTVEEA